MNLPSRRTVKVRNLSNVSEDSDGHELSDHEIGGGSSAFLEQRDTFWVMGECEGLPSYMHTLEIFFFIVHFAKFAQMS